MNTNIISLPNLDPGQEYVINKKNKVKKPNFTMIGNSMKSIEIIADMTKPEAFTFKLLQNNRDYESNIVEFSTRNLTGTEKVIFSKGYKALEEKNLIIRIKKGRPSIYLFNPDFIIPNDYIQAKEKWSKQNE